MTHTTSNTTHTTSTTRWVTITKMGRAGVTNTEVTIPYNGEIFEFLPMDTVSLCRRAACTVEGTLSEGNMIARVWEDHEA